MGNVKTLGLIIAIAVAIPLGWSMLSASGPGRDVVGASAKTSETLLNFDEFCLRIHQELSVADIRTDAVELREFVAARFLEDVCGDPEPLRTADQKKN